MSNLLIKTAVRSLFALTPRSRALSQAEKALGDYQRLAEDLSHEAGSIAVEVPPMTGVDEDMRRWSFHMILEHNAIVNRSISAIVRQLALREPLSGAATLDPKHDVMPSPSADRQQVQEFVDSVQEHVAMVKSLPKLRGTATKPHPIFGEFDAHQWNCMFSFHLGLHYKQAAHVVRIARSQS